MNIQTYDANNLPAKAERAKRTSKFDGLIDAVTQMPEGGMVTAMEVKRATAHSVLRRAFPADQYKVSDLFDGRVGVQYVGPREDTT